MGLEDVGKRIKRGAKRFIEDEGHETPGLREYDSFPELASDAKRLAAPAALGAGIILGTPGEAHAQRKDPIGELIMSRSASTPVDEHMRAGALDSRGLRTLIESIESHRMPPPAEGYDEIVCLAKNMWFEAANQGPEGQEAVGLVTLARVLSRSYPDSICGVVYQRLQFSWTLEAHKRDAMPTGPRFERLTRIAERLYALKDDPTAIAAAMTNLGITADTLFYKRYDWDEHDPNERRMSERNKWFWKECMEVVPGPNGDGRIGDHRFYRAKARYCKPKAG